MTVRRSATSLLWIIIFIVFSEAILSGLFVLIFWGHDGVVADYRIETTRSELLSVEGICLSWLKREINSNHYPKAEGSDFSDFDLRRVFVFNEGAETEGAVYDIDYATELIREPLSDDKLFFPPLKKAFLIRVWKKDSASQYNLLESVYVARAVIMAGGGECFILDDKPQMWRWLLQYIEKR